MIWSLSDLLDRARTARLPNAVRFGEVVVHIDKTRMPLSLIRAVARGDYELPERIAVERMLRPGDRVAEFGGGVGVVSMIAAKIAGPSAVHVFEPQPVACDLIRWNARRNDLEIVCVNAAVAREAGRRTFYRKSNIISSNLVDQRENGKGTTETVTVECVAVDDVIRRLRPNVVICDIEGAETEVLGHCDVTGIEVIILEIHPHVVGSGPIDQLKSRLRREGLLEIADLARANTCVFSRGRAP